jgi:capsular polysaccharide biosynthesis protein
VFTADRHVLTDGDYYLRWKTGPRVYTGRLQSPRERIGGLCSSVWTGEHANYYHWLVDALLRLESLEQFGEPVTLLMPSTMSVLQHNSLRHCLPRNVSLRLVEEGGWFSVERFLVPSFLTPHTLRFLPSDSVRWLRERFIPEAGARAGNGSRIYISRDDASRRRVSNEADVRRMLARHGFRTVLFSQLSMEEQVAVCADASVLVGAHGAGLANLLFARPGAALVELCTRNLDATYLETALAADLRYRYLAPREYGVLPEGTPPRIALSALRDADNRYDVDALEAIVLQTLQEVA